MGDFSSIRKKVEKGDEMTNNDNQILKWVKNRYDSPIDHPELLDPFREQEVEAVYRFHRTYPKYAPTPLYHLEQLARYLHVADLRVKDESHRFGLNAFKVMGGIYAVAKYIANRLQKDIRELTFDALRSPEVKQATGELTFIAATDGNHGRGVAWAARELGHRSVIHMPKGSSPVRLEAIRQEGADAHISDLNYDDCVRMCAELANRHGWILVQDTSWAGYEEIPMWVMQGYASIAREIVDQLEESGGLPPTHIFLQAGVGSFAAAMTAYFFQRYPTNPPVVAIVEADQADCFYRSFASAGGQRTFVTGDMNTIMAGLACGEPNEFAYRLLRQYARGAFSCGDPVAALGMRMYGNPLRGDPQIISGESGAVTLGVLSHLRTMPQYAGICDELGLNERSRVLLISTEGDTDPQHYRQVVWEGRYTHAFTYA